MSVHGLKSAYTDRFDHPTMRCRCGYICGGKVWAEVGGKLDSHVIENTVPRHMRDGGDALLVGFDNVEEMGGVG